VVHFLADKVVQVMRVVSETMVEHLVQHKAVQVGQEEQEVPVRLRLVD
jgi:hypothetical protein